MPFTKKQLRGVDREVQEQPQSEKNNPIYGVLVISAISDQIKRPDVKVAGAKLMCAKCRRLRTCMPPFELGKTTLFSTIQD